MIIDNQIHIRHNPIISYDALTAHVAIVFARYLMISDSPFLHVFDGLDTIHHPIKEDALTTAMNEIGYERILQSSTELPNGKALERIDYRKRA